MNACEEKKHTSQQGLTLHGQDLEASVHAYWEAVKAAYNPIHADEISVDEDSEQEEAFDRASVYDQMNSLGLSWRDFA